MRVFHILDKSPLISLGIISILLTNLDFDTVKTVGRIGRTVWQIATYDPKSNKYLNRYLNKIRWKGEHEGVQIKGIWEDVNSKHRLGHHVFPQNIERMVRRLKIEENNMYLLRHPYLSEAQEAGHAKALGKHEKWMNNQRLEKASRKLMPSVTFEDKFKHLCVSEKWED